jgi:type IV pilus assembly protein PilC
MPIFAYKAKDSQGTDRKGTIETGDIKQATQILTKRRLIVISVKEQKETDKKFLDRFFNKVSFSQLVIITRQLATMIEAGMVLSEAIDILAEQTQGKLKTVLEEVSRDIKSGLDLATAFKKHPDVFPSIYASLIRSGEKSGKLDIVLTQMANTLERDREFRSKVKSAMIYPVMILVMMTGVVGVMIFFVIPRLTSLYTQSNIDLPLPTKILIGTSNFFINYWWLLIIFIGVGVFLFRKWTATPRGKYTFDAILLKTPLVGRLITGTTLTNFTRTFGLLITAGLPLLEAINIVDEIVSNAVYKKALKDCYTGVERGLLFSTQLQNTGVFPKIVSQMFRVGEETGKVDKVSFKMADYFESETDHLVSNLTVIIEPVILVVLGLGVAFVVLSIILPIYKLTTTVQ